MTFYTDTQTKAAQSNQSTVFRTIVETMPSEPWSTAYAPEGVKGRSKVK
jgi:hypothetical protein